jgi:two-component system, cell cycle sensor histidine kinase and response regulator CckA
MGETGFLSRTIEDREGRINRWHAAAHGVYWPRVIEDDRDFYRTLVDDSPDLLALLDRDGRLLYANPAARRVLGDELPAAVAAGRGAAFEMDLGGKTWHVVVTPRRDGALLRARDISDRARSEAALRESEERQRFLVENSADAIWLLDSEFRFQFVSASVEHVIGYPKTEVEGRLLWDFLPPEVSRGIRDLAARDARGEMPRPAVGGRYELPMIRRDGSTATVEVSLKALLDAAGMVSGYHGVTRDISDRSRSEEALRESQALTEEILSAARRQRRDLELLDEVRAAVAREAELPLIIRTVVEGIARAFGYTLVSLYLRQGDMLFCRHQVGYDHVIEQIPVTRGVMGRVARTGVPALLPDVRQDPDFVGAIPGIVSEVCVPLRDHGSVVGALNVENTTGHALDEDDLHLVEALGEHVGIAIAKARLSAEARASEERYRQLVDNLAEGVMIVDPEERILLANPAAAKLFGMPAAALPGRSLAEFMSGEEYARMRAQTEVRRTGQGGTYEIEITRPDGTSRRLQVTARPHRGESGEFIGTLGTIHDVTETRRMESALRQSEERIAQMQKMEAVGRLAGGVAHDFNNLLTVISGYAGMVDEGLEDSHPLKADIRQVIRAAGRAAALTARLLAFSRKQVLQPTVIDLNETVRGLQEMLKRVIGEDVELAAELAADTGNILADRAQVEQVIINLAANARDAMPAGGTLVIETGSRLVESHHLVKKGEYAMLTVRDTGVGMSPETQARLFEPFFTTKEVGKGTGLGLAMAYGIVKQSEGYIFCDSAVGRGTTFTMYFPRVHQASDAPARPAAADGGTRGEETILLVEDEEAVRRLCHSILARRGYHVLEAANGEEALAVIARRRCTIHLLLTDVVMPHMSGPELAARVRETCRGVRILYMSGHADKSLVHHGALDPGIDLVEKPFEAEALLLRVRAALDGHTASKGGSV